MIKHPKNKAERRLIEAKKKKKGKSMRQLPLSIENHNAAIESFLYSMRMIDADDKVIAVMADKSGTYSVSVEKQEETVN